MTATLAPSTVTLTIARQALKTALSRLSGAVGSGIRALPCTQHVKLEVTAGRLTLTATDFDSWARVTVSCDASDDAVALLPAKRLAEIVAALPPVGAVTLVLRSTGAVLTAGRARFEIAGLPVHEFPVDLDVTVAERATVNAAALLDALARLTPHASVAESRPAINAVRLEQDGAALILTAIEGARAARLHIPATGAPLTTCSLHRLAVPVLARLFGGLADDAELTLAADHARVVVESADATAIVRLVDDPFPSIEPTLHSLTAVRSVVCDRLLLREAIRRVALVSDTTHRVTFRLAEEITLRVSGDANNGVDVVAIDERRVDPSHDAHTFALNASFALLALDTITAPRVAIAFTSAEKAIVFRDADQAPDDPAFVLVLPLR